MALNSTTGSDDGALCLSYPADIMLPSPCSEDDAARATNKCLSSAEKRLGVSPAVFTQEPVDSLCDLCAAIDFSSILEVDNVFDTAKRERKGLLVCRLKQDLTGVPSDINCSLCSLFAYIRAPWLGGQYDEAEPSELKYALWAGEAKEEGPYSPDFKCETASKIVFSVQPTSYYPSMGRRINESAKCWALDGRPLRMYATDTHEAWARMVNPDKVDYSLVRSWMLDCERSHGGACAPDKSIPLPGLKVIDCQTRNIIPAPKNCPYIALSYVWGKKDDEQENVQHDGQLALSDLAPVISDAIAATNELGYRYLWVDKCCIDQANAREKHQQITNMDLIYREADITLIAAAGEDASFGLPGVGVARRVQEPRARIGPWLMRPIPPNAAHEILQSKWSTRAWTYQEGLLSSRRLVFTKSQVFVQCNKMACSETLSFPCSLDRDGSFIQKQSLV